MELCDYFTPPRAYRRPVNGMIYLSAEGSHRGECLLATLTTASCRLQTAVAQHKGLRELGVTFKVDRATCKPHLIVHK